MWRNSNAYTLLVEMKNDTVTVENSQAVPQKGTKGTILLSNPLLSIYPKKLYTTQTLCVVITALFITAKM